jgi:hypothetical protein
VLNVAYKFMASFWVPMAGSLLFNEALPAVQLPGIELFATGIAINVVAW